MNILKEEEKNKKNKVLANSIGKRKLTELRFAYK